MSFTLAVTASPRRHWLPACRNSFSAIISSRNLNGEALERAGVGRLVKTYLPGTRLESDAIQSLIDDDAMAARADAIGSRLREFTARRDALINCEAVCMDLLKANGA